MSAMMVVATGKEAHMVADGAFYDGSGTLTGTAPKIYEVPGTKAVFSSRGAKIVFPLFIAACNYVELKSFDDLRAHAGEVFYQFDILMSELAPGYSCEILIAGWSDTEGRAEVLYRQTHGKLGEAAEPGTVYRLGSVSAFGVEYDSAVFDRNAALSALEKARATPVDLTCGEAAEAVMGYSIGGHIDLATVTADGIAIERIHEWPDRIGEKIRP